MKQLLERLDILTTSKVPEPLKVLVVDDEENQREVICQMLDKLYYQSIAVSSGKDALAFLEEYQAEIISHHSLINRLLNVPSSLLNFTMYMPFANVSSDRVTGI